MSMDALVESILGQVRTIAQDVLRRQGVRLRTATVTKKKPVRIRYDGEDDASVITPRTLVDVTEDDRVVVAKTHGQATVLGRLGTARWEKVVTSNDWTYPGHGYTLSILREGNHRWLRGRLQLKSGNKIPLGQVNVAVLESDDRPTQAAGGSAQVAGFKNPGFGRVEIVAAGDLTIGLSKETNWVGFDGVHWTTD